MIGFVCARTLATLRGLYGGSVWKLRGNLLEEHYRLISRQFESMGLLDAALGAWTPDSSTENRRKLVLKKVQECERAGGNFAGWFVRLLEDD